MGMVSSKRFPKRKTLSSTGMGELPDQIRIADDGLILRDLAEEDLPGLLELFDDPATQQFYALAETHDASVLEAFFRRQATARAEGRGINLVVTTEDGQLIGQAFIGLPKGVLGGMISAPRRGHGLAQRVGRLVIAFAHDVLGLETLIAEVEPTNRAMTAVVERLGFHLASPDPVSWEQHGRMVTVMRWEHTNH